MKILILSYSYAPVISPRAFRWSSIAEYWAKEGHNVDVICAWMPSLLREEVLGGVRIHRVGGTISEMLRSRLKKPDTRSNVGCNNSARITSSGIKQELLYFIKWIHDHSWKKVYWPDYACLWYIPAFKKAKELTLMHGYENVITVSLPFTAHLVGLSLKRKFRQINWLVDVGDPFCFAEDTSPNNFKLYRYLNHYVERKVFKFASAITVTVEGARKIYADLFPESASKIHVIPPLVTLELKQVSEEPIFPKDKKIRLVYVGTLYKNIRNPIHLLALFKELLKTNLASRLELHFFGNIHDCQDCFKPYKALLGTKIFLHGTVNHARALQAMKEADILINIGNNNLFQLPSKVAEYVSVGKPILTIAKAGRDSSVEFLKDYPASLFLLDNGVLTHPDEVSKVIQFIRHPPRIEASRLEHWLAQFQVKEIASAYRLTFLSKTVLA